MEDERRVGVLQLHTRYGAGDPLPHDALLDLLNATVLSANDGVVDVRSVENAVAVFLTTARQYQWTLGPEMVHEVRKYLIRRAKRINELSDAEATGWTAGFFQYDGALHVPVVPLVLPMVGFGARPVVAKRGVAAPTRAPAPVQGHKSPCPSCGTLMKSKDSLSCQGCRNIKTCNFMTQCGLPCGHLMTDACCPKHGRLVFSRSSAGALSVRATRDSLTYVGSQLHDCICRGMRPPLQHGPPVPIDPLALPYIPYTKGVGTPPFPPGLLHPDHGVATRVRMNTRAHQNCAERLRRGVAVRCYSLATPMLTTVVDGDYNSLRACMDKKMVGMPPAPAVVESAPHHLEFRAWVGNNLHALLGPPDGPFAAPLMPRVGSSCWLEKWAIPWALQQADSRRIIKRLTAICNKWGAHLANSRTTRTAQDLVRDFTSHFHLAYKCSLKLEKSQDYLDACDELASLPKVMGDDPRAVCTSLSDHLCPRSLNYWSTGVADCVFGPIMKKAAEGLKRVFGINDHITYAFGHNAIQLGEWVYPEFETGPERRHYTGDYKSFDQSHGWSMHALVRDILLHYGYFDEYTAALYDASFPQNIKMPGFAQLVRIIGLASGMTWTSFLNSLVNGLITTFGLHKAQVEHLHGFGAFTPLHDVRDFWGATNARKGVGGDDGHLNLTADGDWPLNSVTHLGNLGYAYKLSERKIQQCSFLGGYPVRCLVNGRPSALFFPIEYRHAVSANYTTKHPSCPHHYMAGVAESTAVQLINMPYFGPQVRTALRMGGFTVNPSGNGWSWTRCTTNETQNRSYIQGRGDAKCDGGWSPIKAMGRLRSVLVSDDTRQDMCTAHEVTAEQLTLAEQGVTTARYPAYAGSPHVYNYLDRSKRLS